MSNNIEYSWTGGKEHFIDEPSIIEFSQIVLGRYGGSSHAGQTKNEDGCLIWNSKTADWEFVILLDGHDSSDSVCLIIDQFVHSQKHIIDLLTNSFSAQTFIDLENYIVNLFKDKAFLNHCKNINGESSCLIVARKDKYIWWFSVGDCVLYLFHPDLIKLGQYQINQRQFYEWIGHINTFNQEVPCYSVGIRELRKGVNHFLLTTDGLIECPNEPYSRPIDIYDAFTESNENKSIQTIFEKIQHNQVKDNTTIISWKVNIDKEVTEANSN